MKPRKPPFYFQVVFLSVFVLLIVFSTYIVNNFNGGELISPITDSNLNHHACYIFFKIIRFFPLPHFDLHTHLLGYPYDDSKIGFCSWFLEGHYVYSFLRSLFGPGPYLQIEMCLSLFIIFFGSFFLLKKIFGNNRALWAASCLSMFNIYAIHKYPAHINLILIHWTILSMIDDFLLYSLWVQDIRITLRDCLVRIILLLLSLGEDLGYIAGFSIVSLILTLGFIIIGEWKKTHNISLFFSTVKRAYAHGKKDIKNEKINFLYMILILVVSYLYVPLCFQILSIFRAVDFSYGTIWWASPLRLFIPWFGFINPGFEWFSHLMHDRPEALGEFSLGWTIVLPGMIGLYFIIKNRIKYFSPILALLLMIFLYHPANFNIFKVFPWFSLMRVSGRLSHYILLFFVLFGCLGIGELQKRVKNKKNFLFLSFLWLGLASYEFIIAYTQYPIAKPWEPPHSFSPFMKKIQISQGEAILDWPFCIQSGNNGTPELCPFGRAEADCSYSRFHGKNTLGNFSGRSNEDLYESFYMKGWRHLLDQSRFKKEHCFSHDEWDFFDAFYQSHNFSGILLHTAFLHPHCSQEFLKRYGDAQNKNIYETSFTGSGPVLFIKNTNETQAQTVTNKEIYFVPSQIWKKINVLMPSSNEKYFLFSKHIERKNIDSQDVFAFTNQYAFIDFLNNKNSTITVTLNISSFVAHQNVKIFANNILMTQISFNTIDTPHNIHFSFPAHAGTNRIRFVFSKKVNWKDLILDGPTPFELKKYKQYLFSRAFTTQMILTKN